MWLSGWNDANVRKRALNSNDNRSQITSEIALVYPILESCHQLHAAPAPDSGQFSVNGNLHRPVANER